MDSATTFKTYTFYCQNNCIPRKIYCDKKAYSHNILTLVLKKDAKNFVLVSERRVYPLNLVLCCPREYVAHKHLCSCVCCGRPHLRSGRL